MAKTSSAVSPRKSLRQLFARGEHLLFVTGAALAIALLMIAGLIAVVVKNGAGYFWVGDIFLFERGGEPPLLGMVTARQKVRTSSEGATLQDAQTQIRVAGRDVFGADFIWVPEASLGTQTKPVDAVLVERWQNGDLFGFLEKINRNGQTVAEGAAAWTEFERLIAQTNAQLKEARAIQRGAMGEINHAMAAESTKIRRAIRTLPEGPERDAAVAAANTRIAELNVEFDALKARTEEIQARAGEHEAVFRLGDGTRKTVMLSNVFSAHRPNAMSILQKVILYAQRAVYFVTGEPRESNTEGGVWPALFGTVMMTMLMSIAVTPFGVLAALYLREYATQGPVVRAVRIAINNLAGVPSIVFGVFGLGFFVYFVGGWVDREFYPDAPGPTFGTGGILWASLTLALLTVPVVIVATEESLAAVPRGVREGSLALGASKFQTICNVVLPAAVPGILTGIILAMARGAGEVAPLMITGVVKLAPEMPFDFEAPFLHVERKFMHLGFHIYDVGFQSPNVEAAKPMVFTTTLLLIGIVILLNIVAIRARDRIRKKFQGGAFG